MRKSSNLSYLQFPSAMALAAGWILGPVPDAEAQNVCTVVGSVCTFPSTNAPAVYTFTGTSGSQTTDGESGPDYTFDIPTDIDINLPFTTAYQGIYLKQIGGDGSYSGPSDGGNGGDITVSGPQTVTTTVSGNLDIGDAAAGILAWTQGGPGTDNNENNNSDGAPGGSGGAIRLAPNSAFTDVTLQGGAPDISTTNDFVGIELRSYGGQGGRLNGGVKQDYDGGDGGDGGDISWTSGSVTVGTTTDPLVADSLVGLRARSVGGAGPNNYNSYDQSDDGGGGYSHGGTGGDVTVTNQGAVSVVGRTSASGATRGIHAQSSGGDGGWAYNVGVSAFIENGGPGGAGGKVDVTAIDTITVEDTGTSAAPDGSAAIFAHSQGAEGGVGQSQKTGGSGGNGGTVDVSVGATIHATGINTDAIFALSKGGQGGAGLSNANNSTGGDGGSGGSVYVNVNPSQTLTITAQSSAAGQDSGRGIVAQSLSNVGGLGSNGNEFAGNPGDGGSGGNGGAVSVSVGGGTISTDGTNDMSAGLDFGAGVFAQSIGGGGGDGGDFSNFLRGSGGSGGTGGSGDTVSILNNGTINTKGAQANGILAQSIGGGGGAGGAADGLVIALGGSGGSGGSSSAVSVSNDGTITTQGYNATGILAQSIVGGGGSAGVSGATVSIGATGGSDSSTAAGSTTVSNIGSISTTGDAAVAVLAQSVGGGGGSAAGTSGSSSTGVLAIGSAGGGAGVGGRVEVTAIGTLSTNGTFAPGLQAQSIGGGGGAGGSAFGIGIFSIPGAAIGGQSGGGGNGGSVTVTNGEGARVRTVSTSSAGLLLQSIGGGGGSGGNAQTGGILDTFQFAIGGSASAAGAGGAVTATLSNSNITTEESLSAGIVAQSIGGGGGSGGSGTSKAASFLNIGLTVGGLANAGGDGGDVAVTLTEQTTISTGGGNPATTNDSIGILAQSIGGGGGTGGATAASAITTGVPLDPTDPDFTVTLNAQFALGGRGGAGGDGQAASVTLSDQSSILTYGAGAHGVLAQSIGGGGGSGGDASTATTTIPDSTQQYGLTINGALGGAGGNGGNGGTASVALGSSTPAGIPSVVTTTDAYSNGVVVQSIGGGGGNSGVPSSKTDTIRGAATVALTFDLGSSGIIESGESGATGGTADLTLYQDGMILTSGAGSRGAVVQSIGGGGGTVQGGEIQLGASIKGSGEEAVEDDENDTYTGTVTVNVGMKSGQGGGSGLVTVNSISGSGIQTKGVDADGLLVQSIGGGGGLGGSLGSAGEDSGSGPSAFAPQDDSDDDIDVSLTVAVGGAGGTGGSSGGATFDYNGEIQTTGDWADGVVVQAIGGGGGTGGTAMAMASGTGETAQVNIAVGGTGGTAGNGGPVTASFSSGTASVITLGYMANGLVLQSIGGGGGQGGDGSAMAAGTLTVGSGVGGSGGTSGTGGTVTIPASGNSFIDITTGLDDSHGLIAQSIGGGGGIGGAGSAASQDDAGSHSVAIIVGGQGGSAGDAGDVSLTFGSTIQTTGDRSFGIVAQSIGGGGGIGGVGSADGVKSVQVGGFGGNGGNGGAVSLDLTSGTSITTSGSGGHGIIAQSIGGGGGIGGDLSVGPFDVTPGFLQSADGVGGAVSVTVDGTITTTGAMAHGIIAQSIGGGGGLGGDGSGTFAGSTAGDMGSAFGSGDVTVTTQGAISATGADAVGIFAQSMGAANTGTDVGTVAVNVSADVTGGSGAGVGILVASGTGNTVTITNGATVTAQSGTAITYTTNGTTVNGSTTDVLVQDGTVIGDILLRDSRGEVAGTITNNSRNSLRGAGLYAANVVNNGRLVIGNGRGGHTLRIGGNFVQTGAGITEATIDFVNPAGSDSLQVAGNATANGAIAINATTLLKDSAVTLVSAGGTLTGAPTVIGTAAVDFAAELVGNGIAFSVADTHFGSASASLTASERSAGAHLDAIFDNRSRSYGTLLANMNVLAGNSGGGTAYAQALSSLTPGASQAMAAAQVPLTRGRLDGAMNCARRLGMSLSADGENCYWADGSRGYTDQSGTNGYDGTTYGFSGGAQVDVNEDWIAGFAAGYEHSNYTGNNSLSSVEGDNGFLAVSVGRRFGNFTLSGALGGSWGSFDTERRVSVPGFTGTATGESDLNTLSGRIRAAYTMADTPQGYVMPILDIDLVHTRAGGYTESGAGIFDLDVASGSATAIVVTPSVEIGTRMVRQGGWDIGAATTLGISLSSEDDWSTTARLVEAPAGAGNFSTSVPIAPVVGQLGLGLSFANAAAGMDIKVEYQGSVGDDYQSHRGLLRFTKRF